LRNVDLQGLARGTRRTLSPERLDQDIRRDDTVCVEQENCEKGARLAGADLDDLAFVANLEGAEDSELHLGDANTRFLWGKVPRLTPLWYRGWS
jgi:hypothetical protein